MGEDLHGGEGGDEGAEAETVRRSVMALLLGQEWGAY